MPFDSISAALVTQFHSADLARKNKLPTNGYYNPKLNLVSVIQTLCFKVLALKQYPTFIHKKNSVEKE